MLKRMCRIIARQAVLVLPICLLIVLQVSCVSPARLLGLKRGKAYPRARLSCYATSTVGTVFADPKRLGTHSYKSGWSSEKNGILYACKGGHIDIAHLRKAADWTAYLAEKSRGHLNKNSSKFSFKLYEPSRYHVQITYPGNWEDVSDEEKEVIIREISIGLGQYFAFVGCTWHEILTWFGYRSMGLYPEFPSAFSWEDTFSNLLGTHIAVKALMDTDRKYDRAMTAAIKDELDKLDIQPKRTAIRAAEKVRGQWFSGDFLFLVDVSGRNFDIGLDDGFVTPWLVPSLDVCPGAQPESYPAPTLDFLADFGFSVKLEIEPKEREKRKILKIVYPKAVTGSRRIEPAIHFAPIMEHIRRAAEQKYGRDIGPKATIPRALPRLDAE